MLFASATCLATARQLSQSASVLPGPFEQAPCCLNVRVVTRGGEPDWIVRAVNVAATDLVHRSTRLTTMEQYWAQYRLEAD